MEKFGNFLELIQQLNIEFDFMTVPESWICQSLTQLYDISGYNAIHSCRGDSQKGGVSFYYNEKYNLLNSTVISEVGYNIVQAEVELESNTSINVISIYRTPELLKASVKTLVKELEQLLVKNDRKQCIIMGDLNLNLDSPSTLTQKYTSLMDSYYFEICNSHVTREASKTRIDHVWSNVSYEKGHFVFTCPMEKDDIIKTDHSLILVRIESRYSVDQAPNDRIRERLNHKRIENQDFTTIFFNILMIVMQWPIISLE